MSEIQPIAVSEYAKKTLKPIAAAQNPKNQKKVKIDLLHKNSKNSLAQQIWPSLIGKPQAPIGNLQSVSVYLKVIKIQIDHEFNAMLNISKQGRASGHNAIIAINSPPGAHR